MTDRADKAGRADVKGFDSYRVTLGDLMRGERATLGKSLLDVQRDLRIKAAYVAAIENSDPSAFQTPGFIAGYVRSYARYLGLDPEKTFAQFCDEAGYNGVHPGVGAKPRSGKLPEKLKPVPSLKSGLKTGLNSAFNPRQQTASKAAVVKLPSEDPLFSPRSAFNPASDGFLAQVSFSGLGSVLMLLALILGLGYGAWVLLLDIQRVDFAPVGDSQTYASALPAPASGNRGLTGGNTPAAKAASLDQLYRPQELAVPVMTPRDGPIAALDPNRIGALVENNGGVQAQKTVTLMEKSSPRVTKIAPPAVAVVASRPAWVRISKADGTVLFEKILDGGESFLLPKEAGAVTLRAGNSGEVYLTLDGRPYGPVGSGSSVAKNVALAPAKIISNFKQVSDTTALAALDSPRVITLNNVKQ